MCGIVGIINGMSARKADFTYPKLVEQAMICNSVRGDDSTGILQYDKKKLYIHRKAVAGWEFAKDEMVTGFIRDADTSNFTLVHNRAATAGFITDEQAHPFTITKDDGNLLAGVHNGTLTGWDAKTYGVDSEWALAQIAEKGDDAFSEFVGAFAFVWYDQSSPNILNMARNTERPMYVGYVKDTLRAVFGSEPDMLAWLCRRNGIVLEPDIIDLTPGRRYSFDINNPRNFTSTPISLHVPAHSKYDAGWSYPKSAAYEPSKWSKEGYLKGIVALLSKPAAPTAAGKALVPLQVPAVKVRMKVQTTVAEEILARQICVLDEEGVFMGDVYDSESRTLWGELEIDGETNAGVMRGVSPNFNKYLQKKGALVVKIIGAFAQPSRHGAQEFAMVVQQKVARDSTDADSIADAVSGEIDNIRRNAALN